MRSRSAPFQSSAQARRINNRPSPHAACPDAKRRDPAVEPDRNEERRRFDLRRYLVAEGIVPAERLPIETDLEPPKIADPRYQLDLEIINERDRCRQAGVGQGAIQQ